MIKFIKTYLTFNLAFLMGLVFGSVISSLTIYAIFSDVMDPDRMEELMQVQNCFIEKVKDDE
jgi:hypothetical protein